MLEYDILNKLHRSGIIHPIVWLSKTLNCSKSKASNLLDGTTKTINLKDMFRICKRLSCTPNDLMALRTDVKLNLPNNHPLHNAIRKKQSSKSMIKFLESLPPEAVEKVINDLTASSPALQENSLSDLN